MQTFLPYSDFEKSAKCLDMRRLGKQRVEAFQLLKGSWPNHPANKMWRGHWYALRTYALVICKEWIERGYKDTCVGKILQLPPLKEKQSHDAAPSWLGDEAFHLSHQSNLIRKFPEYYRPIFGESVPNNLPYIWPIPIYEFKESKEN